MKILITGSTGFLGSGLVRHFTALNMQVIGIDRLLSVGVTYKNFKFLTVTLPDSHFENILEDNQPDILIHSAGPASVTQSIATPMFDFENSVPIWCGILEAVRRFCPACRVIFMSSAAVYGNPKSLPVLETQSLMPISPYGYHKWMCELAAKYYSELYGLSTCSLRVFSAYGSGLKRQVIWDICQKALSGPTVEMMGTGNEQRDFIEVRDIARAVEIIANRGNFRAGIYNVASGTGASISEVTHFVLETLGRGNRLYFNGQSRAGDPLRWQADITQLSDLGFQPRISLEEGIKTYAQWVLDQYRP